MMVLSVMWLPVVSLLSYFVWRNDQNVDQLLYGILGVVLLSTAWMAVVSFLTGRARGLAEAQQIATDGIEEQIEKLTNS